MPSMKKSEELSPRGRRGSLTVGEHAESLEAIRQLVAMHSILIDDGTTVSDSEEGETNDRDNVNVKEIDDLGWEKPLGGRLEGLISEQDPRDPEFTRYRTGGGGGAQFFPDERSLGDHECTITSQEGDEKRAVSSTAGMLVVTPPP